MAACPLCGASDAAKVIYLGLPMRLCACSCLYGFWSFVADWLPIVSEDEGSEPVWAFMAYDGGYLRALWVWLTGGAEVS